MEKTTACLIRKKDLELIIECTYRIPKYYAELERAGKDILRGRKREEAIKAYLNYREELLRYLGTIIRVLKIDPLDLWKYKTNIVHKAKIRWLKSWEYKIRVIARLLYGEREDPLPLSPEGIQEVIKIQDELKRDLYPMFKTCMIAAGSMDFLLSAYHVTGHLEDSLLQFPHATGEKRSDDR